MTLNSNGLEITNGISVYDLGMKITGGLTLTSDGMALEKGLTIHNDGITLTEVIVYIHICVYACADTTCGFRFLS